MTAANAREPLADIQLPKLQKTDRYSLEADIMTDDKEKAIHGLKSGKASGPNRVPVEKYKLVSTKIAPFPLTMFTESKETGELPTYQCLATIIVIHKEENPRRNLHTIDQYHFWELK